MADPSRLPPLVGMALDFRLVTDEDLLAMEARVDAATAGPWVAACSISREAVLALDPPDAAFIAHARTDVPLLIAEVKRLRFLMNTLRGLLDDARVKSPARDRLMNTSCLECSVLRSFARCPKHSRKASDA